MKKQALIVVFILFSISGFSQVINPIYGDQIIIRRRDTASAELQIINSTRNVTGGFLKNTGSGHTTFDFPAWSIITGKPTNFSTTYALSNDIKDSILARLRIIDTAGMLVGY
jgi:hypothetical protein